MIYNATAALAEAPAPLKMLMLSARENPYVPQACLSVTHMWDYKKYGCTVVVLHGKWHVVYPSKQ